MGSEKKASSPAYEQFVAELHEQHPDLQAGSLFGMPCLKSDGKAVLGSYDSGVVFKLSGQAHADALNLDGSILFDPSEKGRPMKAWVVVPDAHRSVWSRLAAAAIEG